jgi:zinc transport system permease protein
MIYYWYDLIDTVLPFQWLEHQFMKNALLGIILVTPLFGILGTMIISNRMAFFSDSLGHGAFTGIALGVMFGGFEPVVGATIFSVIFAIFITLIKNRSNTSTDTIIGVFSSTVVALGLVIMSYGGSFNKFSSYLIGDLLSITPFEIRLLFFVLIGIIILWVFIFNKLLIISINQSFAKSKGVNAFLFETLFTSIIAAVVTITIQWIGLLIINSLLILPAAAARNITNNVRQYHTVSVLIAVFSGITGLLISYYFNTASGATIVLICSLLFFITFSSRNRG